MKVRHVCAFRYRILLELICNHGNHANPFQKKIRNQKIAYNCEFSSVSLLKENLEISKTTMGNLQAYYCNKKIYS